MKRCNTSGTIDNSPALLDSNADSRMASVQVHSPPVPQIPPSVPAFSLPATTYSSPMDGQHKSLASSRALKQTNAKILLFQIADIDTQRRWRNEQFLCCPGKALANAPGYIHTAVPLSSCCLTLLYLLLLRCAQTFLSSGRHSCIPFFFHFCPGLSQSAQTGRKQRINIGYSTDVSQCLCRFT